MTDDQPTNELLVAHFRDFSAEAKRLLTLVHLTVNGITALTQIPRIGEVIQSMEASRGVVPDEGEIVQAKEEAELAEREVTDGFPITYSQFLVDTWGLLEACVRGLVARWLESERVAMQSPAVQRLKVRIGDYERHLGSARFQLIVQLLEREEASSLRNGVDRFESILKSVELDGPVPDSLKRALYELSQLRNCVVHNARRVDRQLIEACPWLDLILGSRLKLKYEEVRRYHRAAMDYSILLLVRVANRRGQCIGGADHVFEDWQ
jgi:hypothetical protein